MTDLSGSTQCRFEMERSIAALALELPDDVWQDVRDKWRSAEAEMQQENKRLREGLRRIVASDFDSGYSWSSYAEAVLSGDEPVGRDNG